MKKKNKENSVIEDEVDCSLLETKFNDFGLISLTQGNERNLSSYNENLQKKKKKRFYNQESQDLQEEFGPWESNQKSQNLLIQNFKKLNLNKSKQDLVEQVEKLVQQQKIQSQQDLLKESYQEIAKTVDLKQKKKQIRRHFDISFEEDEKSDLEDQNRVRIHRQNIQINISQYEQQKQEIDKFAQKRTKNKQLEFQNILKQNQLEKKIHIFNQNQSDRYPNYKPNNLSRNHSPINMNKVNLQISLPTELGLDLEGVDTKSIQRSNQKSPFNGSSGRYQEEIIFSNKKSSRKIQSRGNIRNAISIQRLTQNEVQNNKYQQIIVNLQNQQKAKKKEIQNQEYCLQINENNQSQPLNSKFKQNESKQIQDFFSNLIIPNNNYNNQNNNFQYPFKSSNTSPASETKVKEILYKRKQNNYSVLMHEKLNLNSVNQIQLQQQQKNQNVLKRIDQSLDKQIQNILKYKYPSNKQKGFYY